MDFQASYLLLVTVLTHQILHLRESQLQTHPQHSSDLPLDAICATMKRNIEDLIFLTPTPRGEELSTIDRQH